MRRRSTTAATLTLLLVAAAALGCGGADPSSGQTAFLGAAGAQFVPGALSVEGGGSAPTVASIRSNNTRVFPGAIGRTVVGSVSPTATAVLIGLDGDSGHWLVPTGVEDLDIPGNYVFQTRLSFSPQTPLGPQTLLFRAVDGSAQVGPAQRLGLMVDSTRPQGALVVTLEWDTEADLDLKLAVPNPDLPGKTFDVWAKQPTALPPRQASDMPPTDEEIAAAGQLDFDSNAQCVIDGRRQEDVVYPNAPTTGTYEVRVDTVSLCAEATARWHAIAQAGDQILGEAYGQSTASDTRGSHGPRSGTLAFSFSIP